MVTFSWSQENSKGLGQNRKLLSSRRASGHVFVGLERVVKTWRGPLNHYLNRVLRREYEYGDEIFLLLSEEHDNWFLKLLDTFRERIYFGMVSLGL